jgi:ribose transport system ATP-binding protein
MVGRKVEELYPRSPRTPGQTILDIQNLSGTQKPKSASLQLRRGEILGIAGLVGAGRTELLRAIFGLDRIKSGSIRIAMIQGAAPPSSRWSQRVGMVSEDRKSEGLALDLTIADNLTLSNLPSVVFPSDQNASTQNWINRLGIRSRNPSQKVRDLSGGNQQKVALARLLHHDVDVLLLDEPTRGIDVGSKAEIYRIIDQLASSGKAILMVSSYLPELLGVCDRIAVMHRGILGEARAAKDLDEHRIMLEATGAGAAA